MATFGDGLGALIGSGLAANDLSNGINTVNNIGGQFAQNVAPYNSFGQSFLPTAAAGVNNVAGAAGTQSYEDFMKNYQTSPGANYQIGVANEAQNNSAGAKGKELSGGNERALSTIDQGISSTYANQAYGQYLAGNNQNFGQLETSLGNMFSAIGVGTTVTGQDAGVTGSQMNANASLAAAQAKNDAAKGSGLGSMFSGLGSLATAF